MNLKDIKIRSSLLAGDIGSIVQMHGYLYKEEYHYGPAFECYVAEGLVEFWRQYDEHKDHCWICWHDDKLIASLMLMHRPGNLAQLRFFLVDPAYRGIGLGNFLMINFMQRVSEHNFSGAYLWTTNEQKAAADLYKKHGFILTEEKLSTAFGKPLYEQKYEVKLAAIK